MARKSYALFVAILVTFILLDCLTECGAAKSKGKGKERKKPKPGNGKWRQEGDADISNCVFDDHVNYICGSDGLVYWNEKNLECGKTYDKDLTQAEQSTCSAFPNTDEEKKELADMWQFIVQDHNKTNPEPETKRQVKPRKPSKPKPKPGHRQNTKAKDEKKKRKG